MERKAKPKIDEARKARGTKRTSRFGRRVKVRLPARRRR